MEAVRLEPVVIEKSALTIVGPGGIADIELYDHRFDCESETSEMEYWISVKAVA
jgi:hypothetical protein